jgi:amino acid transporter
VLFNFLSGALINKIASLVNVTYYLTYLLTMTAVLLALRSSRIPDAPARYFSLGVWLSPLAVVGLCWSVIVILDMTIPAVNHSVAAYVIAAELVGLLWYVLVLRSRINQGTAGARLAPLDGRP